MDERAEYQPPCAAHDWNPAAQLGLLGCICRPAHAGGVVVSYRGLDLAPEGKQFNIDLDYPLDR